MTQVSNKGCTLFEDSREGVKARLREAVRGLLRLQGRLYSVLCSRGGLLGGSPTLANLGNDHEFISKEYISTGMRPFGEVQSKVMRAYAKSGQYHTIMESYGEL